MPFQIVQDNIINMKTDAIVNAANSDLLKGGGVCGAIFEAAGANRMEAACQAIGHCDTGSAVITPGFRLSPYVIHAVGPIWYDGSHHEAELLHSAYTRALELATEHHLQSIAFPLISSGVYGYPRSQALDIAVRAIRGYLDQLEEEDLLVYLVLYDRSAVAPDPRLDEYLRWRTLVLESNILSENYSAPLSGMHVADESPAFGAAPAASTKPSDESSSIFRRHTVKKKKPKTDADAGSIMYAAQEPAANLDQLLAKTDESFGQALLRLIDERGLKDSDVYRKANVDRKLFSKIRSNPLYHPKKTTAVALAIALELPLPEIQSLLKKAGFTLSPSSKADIIIEYYLDLHCYNIDTINEALFHYDQPLLGF
ncbi:MAG: macro domain-containing protein [Firmicutes bacterium]|nr:macro domain-containing protein [Bacillota bacterium]